MICLFGTLASIWFTCVLSDTNQALQMQSHAARCTLHLQGSTHVGNTTHLSPAFALAATSWGQWAHHACRKHISSCKLARLDSCTRAQWRPVYAKTVDVHLFVSVRNCGFRYCWLSCLPALHRLQAAQRVSSCSCVRTSHYSKHYWKPMLLALYRCACSTQTFAFTWSLRR